MKVDEKETYLLSVKEEIIDELDLKPPLDTKYDYYTLTKTHLYKAGKIKSSIFIKKDGYVRLSLDDVSSLSFNKVMYPFKLVIGILFMVLVPVLTYVYLINEYDQLYLFFTIVSFILGVFLLYRFKISISNEVIISNTSNEIKMNFRYVDERRVKSFLSKMDI